MAKVSTKVSPVEIEQRLEGMGFPASKQDIISHARKNYAPSEVIDTLEMLPEQEFSSWDDVSKALEKI
jgi:hypothetical protein